MTLTGMCSTKTGHRSGAGPKLNFQTFSIVGTYTYTCPDSKVTVTTNLNEMNGGESITTTTWYNTAYKGQKIQVTAEEIVVNQAPVTTTTWNIYTPWYTQYEH